jgi:hypothetical protein
MIAHSALPLTLRNILDRVGLTSPRRRIGFPSQTRLRRWQRAIAALGDLPAVSNLARHGEIPLLEQPERFRRLCRECGELTPHDGFDEFGAGWYAQICRCRYCGEQNMRVWPLAWW